MQTRTPLYGHTNEATAYLVGDYPYGRTVRCRIRYWLEHDPKRGFRFCSQTEHPTTKVWNKPKRSTYMPMAGCMYLDENRHVHWTGLSEYSEAKEALTFARDFPQSPGRETLLAWAEKKVRYNKAGSEGHVVLSINGVWRSPSPACQPTSTADLARYTEEAAAWLEVLRTLEGKGEAP